MKVPIGRPDHGHREPSPAETSARTIQIALMREPSDWVGAMDAWLELSLETAKTPLEPTVRWLGEALRSRDSERALVCVKRIREKLE